MLFRTVYSTGTAPAPAAGAGAAAAAGAVAGAVAAAGAVAGAAGSFVDPAGCKRDLGTWLNHCRVQNLISLRKDRQTQTRASGFQAMRT